MTQDRVETVKDIGLEGEKPSEILVVDDEKHIRKTLTYMLEKLDYRVYAVDNGKSAIELIQQKEIDLVISDINMPEMSGLELVAIVNKSYRPPEILLITGEPSLESATSAIKLGVFDYVAKPIDKSGLMHTVHRALEKKQLLDQKIELQRENERYQRELEKTLDQRTFHLMQTEEKYRGLFENANIGLGITRIDLRFIEPNPHLSKITGHSHLALREMKLKELFVRSSSFLKMMDLFEGSDKVDQFEAELVRANGDTYWAGLTLKKIRYQGQPAILVTMLDVSDQKRYERSLKRAIADKEQMLGEIHHRTKNNMNVIISILNLQSNSSEHQAVQEALGKVTDRIFAMSLVHDQIYMNKEMSHIELTAYIRSLLARHFSSGREHLERIKIDTDYTEIHIGLIQAIPLGLALNELFSNLVKHPFRAEESGEIQIKVTTAGNNQIEILVCDTGPGFPDTLDLENPSSLGLHMVKILMEDQLQGQVHFSNDGGARIQVLFPVLAEDGQKVENR